MEQNTEFNSRVPISDFTTEEDNIEICERNLEDLDWITPDKQKPLLFK